MKISKDKFLKALNITKKVSDNHNGNNEDGHMTYLTSLGFVSGKVMEIKDIDYSSEESFRDDLAKYIGDYEGIDLFSITAAVYNQLERENQDAITSVIYLKDVKIINQQSSQALDIPYLALFEDQVIGVIPAKLN